MVLSKSEKAVATAEQIVAGLETKSSVALARVEERINRELSGTVPWMLTVLSCAGTTVEARIEIQAPITTASVRRRGTNYCH
jgi:hypothetical protein